MTEEIICGGVSGEDKSFYADVMEEMPTLKLNGHDTESFYTLILSTQRILITLMTSSQSHLFFIKLWEISRGPT